MTNEMYILWQDGKEIRISYFDLRDSCPCATFIDEFCQGSTFPQVVVDGKKLGGCVDTIEFLRENEIAK